MGKNYKNKKRFRTKWSWIIGIPISACIFFIVFGLLIGNVFVIGTWYWGCVIDENEAISVSTSFDSYEVRYRKAAVSEICVTFRDHEALFIDGACVTSEIENVLDTLKGGDKVDLLLHPNSNDIWQMKRGEDTILSFEDSKNQMLYDNIGFSVIGSFGYFCAALGIVSLVLQRKERKKNR